jgi:hypothetical protein
MKIRIIYFRQILLALFLIICYQPEGISQEPANNSGSQSRVFVGLRLGPSQSKIINKGTLSVSELLSTKKNTFSGSLEFGYFFSKFIGFSTGLGFGSYGTELTLDSCKNNFSSTDSENEVYERRVRGSGIKELQKISFLNIPVCFNFQVPFTSSLGFFILTGVNLSVPVSKTYTSSGTFSYIAYYSAYNVLLENIPAYGLVNNTLVNSNGNLELKTIGADAIASAGLQFLIGGKIQIAAGANYNRSLVNISKYTAPDKFQISSDINHINSMMGGSSKATTQSLGFSLSLRYYLK